MNNESLLKEFEEIDSFQPSEEWNQNLLIKLNNIRIHSKKSTDSLSAVMYVIAALLLFNIYFFVNDRKQHVKKEENKAIQTIGSEFLINPSSPSQY